jgi:hypothetical protein
MLASAKISIQQVVFEHTEAQIKDETHKLRESVGVYDINIVSVQVCWDSENRLRDLQTSGEALSLYA